MSSTDYLGNYLHNLAADEELRQRKRRLAKAIAARRKAARELNLSTQPKGHHGGFLSSLIPDPIEKVIDPPLGIASLAAGQIGDAAVQFVPGIYRTARELTNAQNRLVVGDTGPARKLFHEAVESQIRAPIRDITHPTKYPGYALIDLLNFAALGAGSAARAGAAVRAYRAAEGGTGLRVPRPPAPPGAGPKLQAMQAGVDLHDPTLGPAAAPPKPGLGQRIAAKLVPGRKLPVAHKSFAGERYPLTVIPRHRQPTIAGWKLQAHTDIIGNTGSRLAYVRRFDQRTGINENQIWRMEENGRVAPVASFTDKLTPETRQLIQLTAEDIEAGRPRNEWRISNLNRPGSAVHAIRRAEQQAAEQGLPTSGADLVNELTTQKARLDYLQQLKAGKNVGAIKGGVAAMNKEVGGGNPLAKLLNEPGALDREIAATQARIAAMESKPEVAAAAPEFETIATPLKRTRSSGGVKAAPKPGKEILIPQSLADWVEEDLRAGRKGGIGAVRQHLMMNGYPKEEAADIATAIVEHLVRDKGFKHPDPKFKLGNQRSFEPTFVPEKIGPLEAEARANATHTFPIRTHDTETDVGFTISVPARTLDEAMAVAREKNPEPNIRLMPGGKEKRLQGGARKPTAPAPPAAATAERTFLGLVHDEVTGEVMHEQPVTATTDAEARAKLQDQFPNNEVVISHEIAKPEGAFDQRAPAAPAPPPKAPTRTEYVPKKGRKVGFKLTIKLTDQEPLTEYVKAVDEADAEGMLMAKWGKAALEDYTVERGNPPRQGAKPSTKKAEKPKKELPKPKPKAPVETGVASLAELEDLKAAAEEARAASAERMKGLKESLKAKEEKRKGTFKPTSHFQVTFKIKGEEPVTRDVHATSKTEAGRRVRAEHPGARVSKIEAVAKKAGEDVVVPENLGPPTAVTKPYFDVQYMDAEGNLIKRTMQDTDAGALLKRLVKDVDGISDIRIGEGRAFASTLQEVSGRRQYLRQQKNADPAELAEVERHYQALKAEAQANNEALQRAGAAEKAKPVKDPDKVRRNRYVVWEEGEPGFKKGEMTWHKHRIKVTTTLERARAHAADVARKQNVRNVYVEGDYNDPARAAAKQAGPEFEGTPREKGTNPRAQGTSLRDIGADIRGLKALGVPAESARSVSTQVAQAVRAGANPTEISKIFIKEFGKTVGTELFGKWMEKNAPGGGGMSPMQAAFRAFMHPPDIQYTRLLRDLPERHTISGETMAQISPEIEAEIKEKHGGLIPPTIEVNVRRPVYASLSRSPLVRFTQNYALDLMEESRKLIKRAESEPFAKSVKDYDVDHLILRATPKRLRETQMKFWKGRLEKSIEHAYQEQERIWSDVERVFLHRDPQERREYMQKLAQRFERQQKTPGAYVDTVNQITLIASLYARPGYFLPNLLGQIGVLAADHYLNPVNMAKSVALHRAVAKADPEMEQVVRAAMQDGLTDIIAPKVGRSKTVAKSHAIMARFWGKMLDTPFRSASFMNEARRAGFDTPEKVLSLKKPENWGQLVDIARRANKNIIDYGRLGKNERTFVRRVIFFYPWVKGASFWTARFAVHHPIQAQVGVQQGREAEKELIDLLGPVPSFARGMIPGPDINVPGFGNLSKRTDPQGRVFKRLIDPRSLTVQGTLGDVVSAMRGTVSHSTPVNESIFSLVNPAVSAGMAAATRVDPLTGAEFPGTESRADIAAHELLQIPAILRLRQNEQRAAAYASGKKDPSRVLFPYGRGEPFGRYMLGTSVSSINQAEANSRAAAETAARLSRVPREQFKYKRYRSDLIEAAQKLGMKWKRLPPQLAQAIANREAVAVNRAAWQDQKGDKLNARDRLHADLNLAVRMGRLPEATARQFIRLYDDQDDEILTRIDTRLRRGLFNDRYLTVTIDLFNRGLRDKNLAPLRISN